MTDIERFLFNYIDSVLKYEGLLKEHYNLQSIPYIDKGKIPKSGSVQIKGTSFGYNFHGSGCTFTIGDVELSYDIYIDRENYIVTSPYKFETFINDTKMSNEKITEAQAAAWLETLNKDGVVNKIYDDYLVYEINFAWYNSVLYQ